MSSTLNVSVVLAPEIIILTLPTMFYEFSTLEYGFVDNFFPSSYF